MSNVLTTLIIIGGMASVAALVILNGIDTNRAAQAYQRENKEFSFEKHQLDQLKRIFSKPVKAAVLFAVLVLVVYLILS